MILVKDFMIKDVYKLKENDTIRTLLETLSSKRIGGLPIVNDNNELVGIVSDGDVLRHLSPKTYSTYLTFYKENLEDIFPLRSTLSLNKIMKKHVVTLNEDDDLEKAMSVLSSHHFKKLPVLNKHRRVVGIVSRGDVIRRITEKLLHVM